MTVKYDEIIKALTSYFNTNNLKNFDVKENCQTISNASGIYIILTQGTGFNIHADQVNDLKKFMVSTLNLDSLTTHVSLIQHHPISTQKPRTVLPHINHIIAVASGKGGVGKSTIALSLAVSLKDQGLRVGYLDADIYGPSLPQQISLAVKHHVNEANLMIPHHHHGIHYISFGFLIDKKQPVIWRGPMLQKIINQFIHQVQWPDLDILMIDLPPGTGDVQLSLIEKAAIDHAIIVTTPQDLALIDAFKAIKMFEQLKVHVLGLIENMAYLDCPHCHGSIDIYGRTGARHLSSQHHINFLGEMPLLIALREKSDQGLGDQINDDQFIQAYLGPITEQVVNHLSLKNYDG